MKIVNICSSDGGIFALFEDGNIAEFWVGGTREWKAIKQPPKDLFESAGFLTDNYKHVVYICLDEKLCNQKVFYSNMIDKVKELENIYSLQDVENLYPNTKFNRLETNPEKEVFGLTILSTWVSK